MKLFEDCLLACDIDGTLLVNGEISPRAIEKIAYFREEGGHFALSTGRTAPAVGAVLERIPDIGASVVANGCMIYDFSADKVLYEQTLPRSDYGVAAAVGAAEKDVGIEIHCGARRILVLKENAETKDHEAYESLSVEPADFETASRFGWNKVLYAAPDKAAAARVKAFAEGLPNESCFLDTTASIQGRQRYYVEQVPRGVSKAGALTRLAGMLGIKKGCYYAIGDYYNDLEMLLDADIGAAPAESPEEIRRQAGFVTGPAADGAVADFIDYLAKIRKGCI